MRLFFNKTIVLSFVGARRGKQGAAGLNWQLSTYLFFVIVLYDFFFRDVWK